MAEVGEVSSAECPEKLAQINIYQYLRKLFSFRADFQRTSDGRGVRMEFRVYAAYQGCEQKPRKRGTPYHSEVCLEVRSERWTSKILWLHKFLSSI